MWYLGEDGVGSGGCGSGGKLRVCGLCVEVVRGIGMFALRQRWCGEWVERVRPWARILARPLEGNYTSHSPHAPRGPARGCNTTAVLSLCEIFMLSRLFFNAIKLILRIEIRVCVCYNVWH